MSDHAYIYANGAAVRMRCGLATASWPCGSKSTDPETRNKPEAAIRKARHYAYTLGAVTAEIHRPNQSRPQTVRLP